MNLKIGWPGEEKKAAARKNHHERRGEEIAEKSVLPSNKTSLNLAGRNTSRCEKHREKAKERRRISNAGWSGVHHAVR